MNTVLSIPTMMICTSITTFVVALALTYVSLADNRERATIWWCSGMWAATFAAAICSTRTVLPAWFGIGIGNTVATLAFGLVWAGFAAFSGRRPSWYLIAAGPLVWAGCYFGFDDIRSDINNRVVLLSSVLAVYGALVAVHAWRGWKQEHLPSFLATVGFYGLHAVFYVCRIPLALLYPATESHGLIHAPWLAAVAVESFTITIFSTFVFMSLVKERAERRYRLAAEVDSLTSVANRRFFVAETRAALARKPLAGFLAVLDLDYFKSINDTYGHMAGDRVLQSFAHYVQSELGPGMVFGRLGGEEFGLFLPDCGEADAAEFLDGLRAGVEALEIRFNGHVLKVTTSIGAASVEEAGLDFDHLMAGADNALYLAKDEGRNRISLFALAMRLEKFIDGGVENRISLSKGRVSRVAVRNRPGRA